MGNWTVRGRREKIFEEMMDQDHPWVLQEKPRDPRSSVNPKQDKYKHANHPKHISVRLPKTADQEEILKTTR